MNEQRHRNGTTDDGAAMQTYQQPTSIVSGYVPGAFGRLLELQERYYLGEWGLDFEFVRWSGTELVEFLHRYDETRDRLLLAVAESEDPASDHRTILGSIVIHGDRSTERAAQVRWFMMDPESRGFGLGRPLFEAAMAFCEDAGFDRVYLTTMTGLDAAIHLYEDHGFDLVDERPFRDWGPEITLLRYELSA